MFANYDTHLKMISDVLTPITLFPSLLFPRVRATTIFPIGGSEHRRCPRCLQRMVSLCTFFHAPRGQTFLKFAISSMFIVRYSNTMEVYSVKVKKKSQRPPLFCVGMYEYTHVVMPGKKKRSEVSVSSKVSLASSVWKAEGNLEQMSFYIQ